MKKAFVVGHPIAHSKSPLIHTHWLDLYGIEGRYEAIDVAPGRLDAIFAALRSGEYVGGNVTVPHKETAFALCDLRDPLTSHLRAFNTLSVRQTAQGAKVLGTNTDLYGFLANLDEKAPGWDKGWEADETIAIVLGAGGAARAVAAGLSRRMPGAVHVLNRSPDRAAALARDLACGLVPGPLTGFGALAPRTRLVVNTTTIGMDGTRFEGIDLNALPGNALVTDIVYAPLVTPFLAEARALGLASVDGLGMLLHQAVPGFEAWFGQRPEVTPALRALVFTAMGLSDA